MPYEIEFEDEGQDLLRLTVNEETGEILAAEPFHNDLYADGKHHVIVADLPVDRKVHFRRSGSDDVEVFRWLMVKLSLNGEVIAQV